MKSMKFAKRTTQVQNLIWHVDFLQKEISEQRKEIQQRKATMERQKTIIKYLKAELKEVKAAEPKSSEQAPKTAWLCRQYSFRDEGARDLFHLLRSLPQNVQDHLNSDQFEEQAPTFEVTWLAALS